MTDLNKVNFMSKTRFDNLSVTNDDELYLVETNVAVDEEVVHKTGAETIAGNKTFSNNVVVTGTTTLNNALNVNANTKITGALQVDNDLIIRYVSDYNQLSIRNSENNDGHYGYNRIELMPLSTDNYGGYIDFHYAGSTDDYTARLIESASGDITYSGSQRDTASNSTTSGTLAVKGWVNDPAKSTNVVHRTGDETIVGTKTFTTAATTPIIVKSSNSLFSGSNHSTYIRFQDSNDKATGWVESLLDHDGSGYSQGVSTTRLWARTYPSSSSTTELNASIDVVIKPDGTKYATAPTPDTNSNNNNIATTSWVNSKISNILPADYIVEYQSPTGTDARWYRKWNSGWIEQGASGSNASGNNPQIGLVKSFSNTTYTLVVSGSTTNTGGAWYGPGIYAKTKNNFTLYATHSNTVDWYACGF